MTGVKVSVWYKLIEIKPKSDFADCDEWRVEKWKTNAIGTVAEENIGEYTLTYRGKAWMCTCPGNRQWKHRCKHMEMRKLVKGHSERRTGVWINERLEVTTPMKA